MAWILTSQKTEQINQLSQAIQSVLPCTTLDNITDARACTEYGSFKIVILFGPHWDLFFPVFNENPVEWVQLLTGVDDDLIQQLPTKPKRISYFSGHVVPFAEFAMLSCLYFVKQVPRLVANKESKNYDRFNTTRIGGKTMVIIGSQQIASEVSTRATAMGMKVIEVTKDFDEETMYSSLEDADYVIYTQGNQRDYINFGRMSSNAVLVYLGRPYEQSEDFPCARFCAEDLAGLALMAPGLCSEVDHPEIWEAPNLLLNEISLDVAHFLEDFRENFSRWQAGD